MNLDFDRLANLATDNYDLNRSYDYQLKTSFVYFDDAEGEVDHIIMLKNNEPRRMTHVEWEKGRKLLVFQTFHRPRPDQDVSGGKTMGAFLIGWHISISLIGVMTSYESIIPYHQR